jgi:lipoprotein-anchoring transpeptidase ErfK/SrfK
LTNWDVGLLAGNIKKGTPVVFVDAPQGDRKSLVVH